MTVCQLQHSLPIPQGELQGTPFPTFERLHTDTPRCTTTSTHMHVHTHPTACCREGKITWVVLDKGCMFLLLCLFFQSGLGVACKQTGRWLTAGTSWPPRSTPGGCSIARGPAGGAAPPRGPGSPPLSPEEAGCWAAGKRGCAHPRGAAARANASGDTPAGPGLCRKQQGSGVTAPWEARCFCLPGESALPPH